MRGTPLLVTIPPAGEDRWNLATSFCPQLPSRAATLVRVRVQHRLSDDDVAAATSLTAVTAITCNKREKKGY